MNGRANHWGGPGRAVAFVLSATSIGALLGEFYGVVPMRTFAIVVFGPAMLLITVLAVADAISAGGVFARSVVVGAVAGLIAACAYDLFRLPFVYSKEWGLDAFVPPMPLFKVFPRFGAMLLGEPIEQPSYSAAARALGWIYHFSNGASFGVMFLAAAGHAGGRRWWWAVAMAVGLELGMLFTPYPRTFGIRVSELFIAVTLAAHLIFGVALGLASRWMQRRPTPV
jgi:hypothetical protein